MNILHISRTMGQGGAEKVVMQICEETKDLHNVFIASIGGVHVEELDKLNIKHFVIPDIDSKKISSIIKCFVLLRRIIKKEKIDCIHSHHRMAAFYAQILHFFFPKVKLIYTAHNVFHNKKILTQFALKNTTVIAVGENVKKNLTEFYKMKESQIEIIYNTIIPKYNHQKNKLLETLRKQHAILIGNIGRLSKQKGMDTFILALNSIIKRHENVFGIVIGDGEDKQTLETLCQELGIEKNIIFLGYVDNIFDVIRQLDFVVLSSRWEGFPLTPIEVFSVGKSIIASDIGGNNEIVKNNYNGLLFPKDDINSLINAIDHYLSGKVDIRFLEKNAKKDFEKYFSFDTFSKKYNNIYK